MYIIYSMRQSSWVSKGGNYTSDLKEAKQFTHLDAIQQSIRHVYNKGVDWFPVELLDLQTIKEFLK